MCPLNLRSFDQLNFIRYTPGQKFKKHIGKWRRTKIGVLVLPLTVRENLIMTLSQVGNSLWRLSDAEVFVKREAAIILYLRTEYPEESHMLPSRLSVAVSPSKFISQSIA